MERHPSTRISRLKTMASTGRFMKMSVNFMIVVSPLRLRRDRIGVTCRLHLVIDHNRVAALEFELAACDYAFTLFDSFDDRHLVAPRWSQSDERLSYKQRWLTVFRRAFFLHNINGLAVRVEGHCRPGNRQISFGFACLNLDGGRSEERRVGKECRSRWSP